MRPQMDMRDTAYIDMEFGYVYGTYRSVVLPIEIGVVVYSPEEGTVEYTGEMFRYDIAVERWQNVRDACGRRTGVVTVIENPGKGIRDLRYDPRFCQSREELAWSRLVADSVYADLRTFMEDTTSTYPIDTLIFFAASMERKAFQRAGFSPEPCIQVDLQRRIKQEMQLRFSPSLEVLSWVIEFRSEDSSILSTHFRYPLYKRESSSMELHSAMGDAARIFLISREFFERREEFRAKMRPLAEVCGHSRRNV